MRLSFLLITVREKAYHGCDDDTVGRVISYLNAQTFAHDEMELVVVDAFAAERDIAAFSPRFRVVCVPPRDCFWVRQQKVAICAYRNTGLSHVTGNLIVNLDDACVLPPTYASTFWSAYENYDVCLAGLWPGQGDTRPTGRCTHVFDHQTGEVRLHPSVFGFGSYPLTAALEINGYDEVYDGGQGLEDLDIAIRFARVGVHHATFHVPGFSIHPQTAHSIRAIAEDPIAKCCNAAWQVERVWRQVVEANVPELWTPEALRRLVGPCVYLDDKHNCLHHRGLLRCAYLDKGFPLQRTALQDEFLKNPPVFDLAAARKANGLDA